MGSSNRSTTPREDGLHLARKFKPEASSSETIKKGLQGAGTLKPQPKPTTQQGPRPTDKPVKK